VERTKIKAAATAAIRERNRRENHMIEIMTDSSTDVKLRRPQGLSKGASATVSSGG